MVGHTRPPFWELCKHKNHRDLLQHLSSAVTKPVTVPSLVLDRSVKARLKKRSAFPVDPLLRRLPQMFHFRGGVEHQSRYSDQSSGV